MWYFVVFQPSKCKKTHFQPQIWSIWPIFPKDSESLPKFCYIKRKNSEILSKLRNSEPVGVSGSCWWTLWASQGTRGNICRTRASFSQSHQLQPYISSRHTPAPFLWSWWSQQWDFQRQRFQDEIQLLYKERRRCMLNWKAVPCFSSNTYELRIQ